MIRISRKLEYALMAVKLMSGRDTKQLTTTKEICEQTNSPFDATAKVMQQMVQHGLLGSAQGIRGGYYIIKNLSQVSLLELMEMVLGPVEVAKCITSVESCEFHETCNIKSPLRVIQNKLTMFYSQMMLSELLLEPQVVKKPMSPINEDEKYV